MRTEEIEEPEKGMSQEYWDFNRVGFEKLPDKSKWDHTVTSLENFLQKCSIGYILYPWISLLEPTLEISYKP